jgi:hypothetical protein
MSGDVVNWLIEGRSDVAVLYEAHKVPSSKALPFLEDELCLIELNEGDFRKYCRLSSRIL